MKKLLVSCLVYVLIVPLSCFGKTTVAFSVDDVQLSERVFTRLWQKANGQKPISQVAFKSKLIETLVLGKYAKHHYPQLNQASNVGYDPKLTQSLQLNRLLLDWFEFDSKAKALAAKQHVQLQLSGQELAQAIGKPSILGYELTPKQRELAQHVVVATFTLDTQSDEKITLAELYDEQSVQGRMAFHQGDLKQVSQFAVDRFYVSWHKAQVLKKGMLQPSELTALERIVEAKYLEMPLLLALGALSSEHGDDEGINRFKQQVSQAEISQFYQANKKDFAYVSEVKGQYLRFANENDAVKAHKRLAKGELFADVAKSLGQSGTFAEAQDGWLHVSKKQSWLSNLAFALPKATLNRPVRGPQGLWYLVKVDDKRNDFYPATSETVVFQATRAIAAQKAQQAFNQLKQQLMQQAQVVEYEKG